MEAIDSSGLIDGIKQLQQLRDSLLARPLSPAGAWIHEYEVQRTYRSGNTETYGYAKWQAPEPIFKRNPKPRGRRPRRGKDPEYTCHQHIGRVWSSTGLGTDPAVESAYQAWENRQQLEAVETALIEIQAIVARFDPKKDNHEREPETF